MGIEAKKLKSSNCRNKILNCGELVAKDHKKSQITNTEKMQYKISIKQ